MNRHRDVEWIAQRAVQPFLSSGEGKPPPELPLQPILLDHPYESPEDRFDRIAEEYAPRGSQIVKGTRVYSMDGDGSGWLFMRDPAEFS